MTPPLIPAPDAVPMPAPPFLLWALLMATFFVHVVLTDRVARRQDAIERRDEMAR